MKMKGIVKKENDCTARVTLPITSFCYILKKLNSNTKYLL